MISDIKLRDVFIFIAYSYKYINRKVLFAIYPLNGELITKYLRPHQQCIALALSGSA